MKTIKRFIDEYENDIDYEAIKYSAGKVSYNNGRYYVSFEQVGARETFSIGQPVYDYENNIMGYLGIVPVDNLYYSSKIRIPVEQWEICLPTEHCKKGKQIFTYWQILEDQENE